MGTGIEEKIQKKHGTLTPEIVVTEAGRMSSPIHDYFTWDNDDAADKWRKQQARVLIIAIDIKIVSSGRKIQTRAWVNVSDEYKPIEIAIESPTDRDTIIQDALKRHKYWEEQNAIFEELAEIIDVGRKTRQKLKFE